MPNILKSVAEVSGAPMADLVATYKFYAGRSIVGFANQVTAERRVTDAMMISANARGHLGIPKDSKPAATAHAELVEIAAETKRADPREMAAEGLPGSQAGLELDPQANPYPAGTLAARLWAKAEGLPDPTPEPEPRARVAAEPTRRSAATATTWFRVAPGTPLASLQKTSVRAAVFRFIESCTPSAISMGVLVDRFGDEARGCVRKLIATKHLEECAAPSPVPPTKE